MNKFVLKVPLFLILVHFLPISSFCEAAAVHTKILDSTLENGTRVIAAGLLPPLSNDRRSRSRSRLAPYRHGGRKRLPTSDQKTLAAPQKAETDSLAETLDLLTQGEHEIRLDPAYKDVILVMGNTGAGKTTITKFLTQDNADLLSYESVDGHYLIKDTRDSKISENSTLISKSIFPDLFIENSTDTPFYDYPGFSDTRSPSVEIANAFFMKKVADYADSVKILFVINYNSLKIGHNRLDFRNMMDHALKFIKNPAKFSTGIALIATRIEYSWTDEKLIRGIAKFLESVTKDLPTFFQKEEELENARNLINAFLSRDEETGEYNRIGLFRQPDELGPLDQIQTTQSCKTQMEQVIWENIEYVSNSVGDFGVTISPKAKLLLVNLGEEYSDKITDQLFNLGSKIGQHFVNLSLGQEISAQNETRDLSSNSNGHQNSSELQFGFSFLSKLKVHEEQLDTVVHLLENETNRSEFLSTVFDFVQNLTETPENKNKTSVREIRELVQKLKLTSETLDFFDSAGEEEIRAPTLKWTQPIKTTHVFITNLTAMVTQILDQKIKESFSRLAGDLKVGLESKIQSEDSNFKKLAIIELESEDLSSLILEIKRASTIQNIIDTVAIYMKNKNNQTENEASNPNSSTTMKAPKRKLENPLFDQKEININLKEQKEKSTFSPFDWTKPLENLLGFLQEQKYSTSAEINKEISTYMDQLGLQLIQIYKLLPKFQLEPDSESELNLNQMYEKLMEELEKLFNLRMTIKNSNTLRQFSTTLIREIPKMEAGSEPSINSLLQKFQFPQQPATDIDLDFDLDLFAPINGRTSPFKIQNWFIPLEKVMNFLQTKINELAIKLGQSANEQKVQELKDQQNLMENKLKEFRRNETELLKRQEEERKEWQTKMEQQQNKTLDEFKKQEDKFDAQLKDAEERANRIGQEMTQRQNQLEAQNNNLMRQLEKAKREQEKSGWLVPLIYTVGTIISKAMGGGGGGGGGTS